ncbi:TrlF family AAA-like ATPase [Devosia sp. LjRoot16]|uniref:TrlF family AAA-like ATPase n=1 Tax=Devosia sp. LjRoot16 TaxID=3342271 RepID=UPI003F4FF0E6
MADYASFRKCDFQVHSCRDPNWRGSRPCGEGDALSSGLASATDVERERRAWARTFVDACVTKSLRAVAVTDHHEMVMIPYIQEELKSRRDQGNDPDMWLFPGMELTCQEGAQAIILFDTDLEPTWWTNAQGALRISHASIRHNDSTGLPVTQLNFGYDQIGELLDSVPELRGRYIVLPNVSQGGSNSVLRTGWHQKFSAMPYVGGYLDAGQTIASMGGTNRQRLSGEDRTWGNRPIYPMATSDARDAGFPQLGTNSTWIKLSVPTAESIRQAFLAAPSRIKIEEPTYPDLTVRSLRIHGTRPLADLDVLFSPELNCIIGGRGSGKSTLLEYLAFGLGRSCYDLDKEYSGRERLISLIRDTVVAPNAEIVVDLVQDGAAFRITRSPANGYQPALTYPDGNTRAVPDKELRSMFPAVAYSQGELSELGSANADTKITDLLAFVEPTYKYEADHLESRILTAKTELDASYRQLAELWRGESERTKSQNRITALQARVASLQSSLPKLDPADQAVLDKHDRLLLLTQAQQRFEGDLGKFANDLDALKRAADSLESLPGSADSANYSAYAESANTILAELKDFLGKLRNGLSTQQSGIEPRRKAWGDEFDSHKQARDAVLQRVGVHASVQKQITELQDGISAETNKLQEIERGILELGDPVEDIRVRRQSLKTLVAEQLEKLKTWTSQIEEHSDHAVLVKMDEAGDLAECISALEIAAARTRSQNGVRERNFGVIVDSDGAWQALDLLIADTAAALRWKLSGADPQQAPRIDKLAAVLGEGDSVSKAFLELVDIDRLAALVKAVPRARISFWYKGDGAEITFEKASEGQRAAALLMMLIKQGGGPLLVDQPEGDLDNSVVTRVVELMHAMKHRRQIFFATHNANLVVNGAAELVAVMANSDTGTRIVESRGAIDIAAISRSITKTMEGGEQAFRDRQRKYGF